MSGWVLTIGLAVAAPDLPSPPAPQAPVRALGTDWQSLSPLLRVRPFVLSSLTADLQSQVRGGIGRQPVDDLRLVVVVDTPETVGVVGSATLSQWDKSEAEVYAVARAHTRTALRTDLERRTTAFPSLDGTAISGEIWTGGDTVSALADLGSLLPPTPLGVLVSAPARDLVMVHTLDPERPLAPVLATFAALTVVGAPPDRERFSRSLYWWVDGELRALAVEDPDPGRPRVVAGPTLDALHNRASPLPEHR